MVLRSDIRVLGGNVLRISNGEIEIDSKTRGMKDSERNMMSGECYTDSQEKTIYILEAN